MSATRRRTKRTDPEAIRVAVLRAKGTGDKTRIGVENFAEASGFPWQRVLAKNVADEVTVDRFDVLYVPGGWAWPYIQDIDPAGKDAIRTFVEDGGCFVGVCAGAYFAADLIRWQGRFVEYDLDLFPGLAEGPIDAIEPWYGWRMTPLASERHAINEAFERASDAHGGRAGDAHGGRAPDTERAAGADHDESAGDVASAAEAEDVERARAAGSADFEAVYWGGPSFRLEPGHDVDVLARYGVTGDPATITFPRGLGQVLIMGCHLELGIYPKGRFDRRGGHGARWDWLEVAVRWMVEESRRRRQAVDANGREEPRAVRG